ncbi:hypothetical protein AB0F96_39150 [Streptomyces sp. NPDC023998]|uniref:hypothetical protein n=1 Tax=Streptomyces sp. NPDC023998 TaxID=3154597 RepID=UPI00340A4B4D
MDHISEAVPASTADAGDFPLPMVPSNAEILRAVLSLSLAATTVLPTASSRPGKEK